MSAFSVAKSKLAMMSIEKWLNLKIDCEYIATSSLDLETFKVDTEAGRWIPSPDYAVL